MTMKETPTKPICIAEACGCYGTPKFDGMDQRYVRVLWAVIAINATMFIFEMVAGQLAGSQALQADALDFLGDTLTYGISLAVIGQSLALRSMAAIAKGVSLLLMGYLYSAARSTTCSCLACRVRRSWAASASLPSLQT